MTDEQRKAIRKAMQDLYEACWQAEFEDDHCEESCPFAQVCAVLRKSKEVSYSMPCEWAWAIDNWDETYPS